ncbi:MAG: TonB-dependent receptor [Cytophagales bacterium]|nr:MAG: TonB-dependent receptor [Cytophagales bacterium]TAF61856.1 MAG: TonB-dependent receptor [Cytophagales bacterium]
MKHLVLLMFWLFCSSLLFAQHCKHHLVGQVRNTEDEPLPFSYMLIANTQEVLQADSLGQFHYHHLCNGQYSVHVSSVGYQTAVFELIMPQKDPILYVLKPDSTQNQLSVEVKASFRQTFPLASEQIKGYDIDKKSGQPLAEMLSGMNGVTALTTGATIQKPVIHGLHSSRVLILNYGVRHEAQQWGSEHAPEIDPSQAQKITVLKGASALRYGGDAIAGVVLVAPPPMPQNSRLGGFLSAGAASNGRMGTTILQLQKASARIKGLSWRIHGSAKRSGNLNTPKYFLGNTGLSEKNISFALNKAGKKHQTEVFYSLFNTQIGILSSAHIGNLTDLKEAINRLQPLDTAQFSYKINNPRQDVTHHFLKLSNRANLKKGQLETVYAFQLNQRQEYDKHRPRGSSPASFARPSVDLELFTHLWEAVFIPKISQKYKNWYLQTGLQSWLQYNFAMGRQSIVPDYWQYNHAAFVSTRYVYDNWEVEAGLRWDMRRVRTFQSKNDSSFSYNLFYQKPIGNLVVKRSLQQLGYIALSYSRAWRPPTMNELFSDGVHHGSAAYEKGDVNLKVEQAHNMSLDCALQKGKLSLNVSCFWNNIQNFVYLKPTFPAVLTIRGAFPAFAHTQTNAIMRGVDAEIGIEHNEWHYRIQGAYLKVTEQSTGNYLVGIMPNQLSHQMTYTKEREGKKLCMLSGSIKQTLVAAQNLVPPNSDYAAPPAAFMLLEADLGCFFWVGHQEFKLNLSVQNMLNTTYRNYMNRLRYYADETGRNICLRLKVPF